MGTGLDIEDILEILAALNLQFRHLLQFMLGERRIEDNVYFYKYVQIAILQKM